MNQAKTINGIIAIAERNLAHAEAEAG
jgi:hypothetical protein